MDKSFESAFVAALDWWASVGVEVPKTAAQKPKIRPKAPSPQTSAHKASTPKPHRNAQPSEDHSTPSLEAQIEAIQKLAAPAKDLPALKTAISGYDMGTLSANANSCVFSRGNPKSSLMIIGEAVGRDEDIAGKPFVGRAGQLLDLMLAAIGLTEDDVYITNVINWRPPGNRNPSPEEIELFRPFLTRHITLAAPKALLIVGGVSLTAMTGLNGIMKNRGQWQSVKINGENIPALPIYHPAFLLRRPEMKKEAWRDLLALHDKLSELT